MKLYPEAAVRLRTALLLFLAVLCALPAFGQERFGEVNGSAMDRTGAVLPNADLTLTNNDTKRVYTTKTGGDGSYVIRSVDPGMYTARFTLNGFSTAEIAKVQVAAGKVITLNGTLEVGTATQSVQVNETAPLIDTTTTMVAHNVNQEEFNRLPKSRTFQSIAQTAPGVNSGTVEGGIQVNGASGAENQYVVDGISTNSLIEGHSRQNAAFEILEEVQVKTAGIEAQYGGALGGVISAITRSGGNSFHGDLHYYYYGNRISAGPVKRLLMDPNDQLTVSYVQDHKSTNDNNEYGYSLGGRIIRDKLFFFSAASPNKQYRELDYLSSTWQPVRLTQNSTYMQAYNKLSFTPFNHVSGNLAWLYSPSHVEGVFPGFNGYGNQRTDTAAALQANQVRGTFSPQSNYSGNLDFTLGSTSLLQLRGAYFYDNYKSLGTPNVSPIEWGVASTGVAGLPADLQRPINSATTPRVFITNHDLATRLLTQADFSHYVSSFGGSHDFKVGIGRMKNVNNVDTRYGGGGYITLFFNTPFTSPLTGQQTSGKYGYYQLDNIGTFGSTGGIIDNIYVQDRWRPIRRLSIDAGVRLERERVPSFRRDVKDYAFEFGWGQKVAPRLGASFDVFGDGRLKVYGSWGMFYDWVKYELSRGTFGGDVWTTTYRTLDNLDDVYKLTGSYLPGTNLWNGPFQDHRKPSFGSDQIDPNLKPMSSWLAQAGAEFQLSPRTVVAARYTRNQLREAIEDIGTIDAEGNEVYIYGNPGEGIAKLMAPSNKLVTSTPVARPVRQYDALELSFTRRFSNRWFASGSYVFSRLYGNYSGLASSDEINPPATGRVSTTSQQVAGSTARPGTAASRYYDLDYVQWDAHGNYNVLGRLATDRPHVVKLYGSYTTKWNTEVGGFFYGGSGTPMSTYVNTSDNAPIFVNGRGDMGRTPFLTQTDLVIAQEIKKFGEGRSLRFEFNAQNLFNQKTSRYTYNYLNRFRIASSGLVISQVNFTKPYDYRALIGTTADASKPTGAYDPRYGKQDLFNPGFSGRIGVKFIF